MVIMNFVHCVTWACPNVFAILTKKLNPTIIHAFRYARHSSSSFTSLNSTSFSIMPRSSENRSRIAEAFRLKPANTTSGALQYTARNNDNKSILRTTAHQHSPDTHGYTLVAKDHQVDLNSDEESNYQASLDQVRLKKLHESNWWWLYLRQVHKLQQRLSASERKLAEIEERYNGVSQAMLSYTKY